MIIIHLLAAASGTLPLPPTPAWASRPPPNSQVDQMFQFSTIDAAGNLDYKALSYALTHGEAE